MASAAGLTSFASVVICLWMFFTSAQYQKTLEGKLEVRLPQDRSLTPLKYYETMDNLRIRLRYDEAGRLARWVGETPIHTDEELMAALTERRDDEWDVPVGIDAQDEMAWAEIVRTMGLCEKQGLRVEMVSPMETPRR